MENSNLIYNMDIIQKHIKELKELEKNRVFCAHNMEHFLSVARICYILCLENNIDVSKDVIYSTALLHDLGRVEQYKHNVDHDIASVEIAKSVLPLTSFSTEEKQSIVSAISSHREKRNDNSFESFFYQADKLSRTCFDCNALGCNWSDSKKNLEIKY